MAKSSLGATHYWWYELAALLILLTLYVRFSRRNRLLPLNLIAASCVTVIGLHLMSLL